MNLAKALDDESLAERLAQRDIPQPDDRMQLPSRRRDRKLSAFRMQCLTQSRDQIARQEGTVARGAENPLRFRPMDRSPIEPGQDSSQRSWIMLHGVGDDRQTERSKAKRIAIGVQNQGRALRRQPSHDVGENCAAADLAQWLVAAAHSPRQPTGKHDAWDAITFARHARRPFAIDDVQTSAHVPPMIVTKLDLSGLKCPLPALKTRKALRSLAPGDRLEVRCTDPLAVIDIPHLVGVTGDRLEAIERSENDIVFRIEKTHPTVAA